MDTITTCTTPEGREFVSDGEAQEITRHAYELAEFGRCRYCGERDDHRTGDEDEAR